MKHLIFIISAFLILYSPFSLAHAFPPAPVPQTGQTLCYDSAGAAISCADTGQDGELQAGLPWPSPRFVDNSTANSTDQTVTDKLTGLIWTKNANLIGTRDLWFDYEDLTQDGQVSWQYALNYVKKLNEDNYLGHNDWRLPNINELHSLKNWQQANSATFLNGQGFVSVQTGHYWSSTTIHPSLYDAYCFGLSDPDNIGGAAKSESYYVWPVRGGQQASLVVYKTGQTSCWDETFNSIPCAGTGQDGELQTGAPIPNPRFIVNTNQTVTDNLTDLVWSRNGKLASAMTWQQSLDHIKQLNVEKYLGYNDWRLPNINELRSLIDELREQIHTDYYNVATWLNEQGFFRNVQTAYWSSSSHATYTNDAWAADLQYNGGYNNVFKSSLNRCCIYQDRYVWPVRGGQYSLLSDLLIAIDPQFGIVKNGGTLSDHPVTIVNRGGISLTMSPITITGTNAAEFTINTGGINPCDSLAPTVAAGASCTLILRFTPANSGAKSASLDIAVNSSTKSISLSGKAISTVYGTVTDQSTGLPIPGATVTLNTSASAVTETNGTYTLTDLSTATYSITINKSGYQQTIKTGLAVTSTTSAKADILLPSNGTLNISSTSLPWASPNVSYSSRVMVGGGIAPYTFSRVDGTLPTGLTLDTTTGTISGTPTGTGSYTFAIGVTDNVSGYSEKEFTIDLVPPLQITTISLPSGQQGVVYSRSITAYGGKPAYNITLVSGIIPNDLNLGSDGAISGTPRESGTFNITVRVTDSTGITFDKRYTLTLTAASPLILNTATLPQGYSGSYFSTILSASGGVPQLTFSVNETLPEGLSFNPSTGELSGIPSAAGFTNLTFNVTDNTYPTAVTTSRTIPLRIWSALVISTTTIPDGTQKAAYSTTLTGSGGATSRSWSLASGTLPQGITFGSTTGILAGTPAACGAFPFTARLTDAATLPKSVDSPLTFNVACSNDYIISGNAGVAGATVSYSGTASGTVTANGSGNYSLGPLQNGSYTITPTKPLYIFTPATRAVAVNNLDVPVSAFAAALDTTAPTVTGFTLPATATALAISVATFTATDNVAVSAYLLTESATTPLPTNANWSANKPATFTFSSLPDGIATQKSLYAWAKDAAGNVSLAVPATTTITLPDVTKPTITGFTIPATGTSLVIAISTFTATDNVAVTGYCITEADSESACSWSPTAQTSYTFTTAGSKTLYVRAKDSAGNISLPVSANVTVSAKSGDSDGDGSVSIAEVQSAINMFLGVKTVEVCVDSDSSSVVSIAEVQKVINGFLGL